MPTVPTSGALAKTKMPDPLDLAHSDVVRTKTQAWRGACFANQTTPLIRECKDCDAPNPWGGAVLAVYLQAA